MKKTQTSRRHFIKDATNTLGTMALLSALPINVHCNVECQIRAKGQIQDIAPRIKFEVISIIHSHINSLVEIVLRGGGVFVSFYAKEADLAADFDNRCPHTRVAQSDKEILQDKSIQLVVSGRHSR
jgi:hypothetical protein